MRFKYLSLCLFALSMSGCTQHVIKSNSVKNLALSEQATQGLNALFEHSSYDMKGQFSIQTDLKFQQDYSSEKNPEKPKQSELDPELKKQIDQIIRTQNIPLSFKEKQTLYLALANESVQPTYDNRESGSSKTQIGQSLVNVLNDLQFSYSSSVHFRQKIAALTLQLNYQKPTLQVQAQLPMVIDFNELKFYTNYFAVMPFMVNRNSQDRLAYVDFSKYRDSFEKVDIKKFAEYLKQMNALTYLLAEDDQISALSLTNDEKRQGLIKKIRFVGDLDTIRTQLELFEYVNEIYYTEQLKGEKFIPEDERHQDDETVDAVEAASEAEEQVAYAEAEQEAVEEEDSDKAYASSERVYQFVNEKMHSLMYHEHDHSADAEESTENESDQTAYDATAETASEAAHPRLLAQGAAG